MTNIAAWNIINTPKIERYIMGKLENVYLIDDVRYEVEIKASALLGRVSIKINDDKFVLRSFPFRIGRCEPFKIGDKRCMLTVSNFGKVKID